jgi:FkbM family methyltransferase
MNFQAVKYFINRFVLRRQSLIAPATHFGLDLHVKTEDVVGRHLYKYGAHEPATTEFLEHFLKLEDGDVVVDIGANIGWYSLIFDRIAGERTVDVFAFEPDPVNFALLTKNISRNLATHVSAVQSAVADVTGNQTLYLYKKSNRGRHSMLAIHDGESVDVETVTLDEFWDSRSLGDRVPRFIKMDIEGFELMALSGATGVLSRCPMVMLEYSPGYMQAASLVPGDLLDLMLGLGFEAHALVEGKLQALDADTLRSSSGQVDIFWLREQTENGNA